MTEQLREIKKLLSSRLKKDRYEHTIGVMYTAAALAMNYGEEIQAALTAGLLHDCGKYCSAEEQIQLCRKKKIALSDAEEQMPALVHGKAWSLSCKNMSTESSIRVSLMRSDGIPPDVLT